MTPQRLILILAGFCGLIATSNADNARADNLSQYFGLLSELTQASPVESAVSHGSEGLTIGMGLSRHNTSRAMPLHELYYGGRTSSSLDVTQLHLSKGTPLPVDFGMILGTVETRLFTSTTFFGQWTVYEALRHPAVALRGSYGRIFDIESTNVATMAVEGLVSYGFFNFFTAFTSMAVAHHEAEYHAGADPSHALFFLPSAPTTSSRRSWFSTRAKMGLQLALGTPLARFGVELQDDAERRVIACKLSLGI